MDEPTYGSRRMRDELIKLGYKVGRKRVQRLMRIEPIYPKPRLSIQGKGHKKYSNLLRNLEIFNSDQGSQFTGEAFTGELKARGIKISMDWQRPGSGQRHDRAPLAHREV
jgi:transposase InsO family protein